VLELDHPTTRGLYVCDMMFTGLGMLDNLLPISRKLVFPGAIVGTRNKPGGATIDLSQCRDRLSIP
jgi:hypothetical protein